jgi:hypothetical protein
VRTRWDGKDGSRSTSREPDQASRAAPLVPGLALRRQPALEGEPRGLRRLKCVRTDPAFGRDGRGRRQDAGRRAHVRAGDREAENPETPPCEGGLGTASTATGSSPAEATAAMSLTLAGPLLAPMPPRFRTPPEAPLRGRDGRKLGPRSISVKEFFRGRGPDGWRGCVLSGKLRRGDQPGGGS